MLSSIWCSCVIFVGSVNTILAANIPISDENNQILIITDPSQLRLLFNAGMTDGVNVQATADTRSLLQFFGSTLISLAALLFGVGGTTTTGTSLIGSSGAGNGLLITALPGYGNGAAINAGLNVISPSNIGTVSHPGLAGTSASLGAGVSSGGSTGLGLGGSLGGSPGVSLGGSLGGSPGVSLGGSPGVSLGGSSGGSSAGSLGGSTGLGLGGSLGGSPGISLGGSPGVSLGGSPGGSSGGSTGLGLGGSLGGSPGISLGGSPGVSLGGSSGGNSGLTSGGVSLGNGITTTITINGVPVASVAPLVSTSSSGTQVGVSTPVIVSASISSKSDKNNFQNDVTHPYGKVTYFIPDGKNHHGQNSQHPKIIHKIEANKTANGTESVTYEGVQYLKKKK